MNKKLKSILWICLIITLLAIIFYPKLKEQSATDKGKSQGGRKGAAVVKVIVVKPGILREVIKASGSILSDEEIDLAFETSGKIESISFEEGKRVKKGQLLAKLIDDDLRAQLNKLQVQRKLLLEKSSRQKILLEKEAISQESYDQAATDLLSTDADIKLLEVRINETQIHAPFNGTLGLRYVSEGAYVTPTTRIAKLVKTTPLKVSFAIPERYSDYIKPGSELTFHIEGDLNSYRAKVYAIEPVIESKTRTIAVRAIYNNSNEEILPGRYVTVELIIREQKDAIQLPAESIIPDISGEKVFVVKNRKATSVNIITGLRSESLIEVVKGLNSGDSVVTSGILQLRSDMTVVVEKEKDQRKTGSSSVSSQKK